MTLSDRFRSEVAAGGAVDAREPDDEITLGGRLTGVGMAGLLVWLAVASPWIGLFVFGLIASVFLHEVGHFVTARRTGMKVTQFFMGFGPRVWSFHRGGVEYGVRALPLGAFVRIVGMNNLDEVDPDDEPVAYRSKSYPRRMLVITAGSLMHLIIAAALFTGVYSIGGRLQETGAVTVRLVADADSPAARAGIRAGDVIVSFDGTSVTSRDQLVQAITSRAPGETVEVVVERDGARVPLSAVLDTYPGSPNVAYLGVSSTSEDYVRLSPPAAIGRGFGDIVDTVTNSVRGVFTVLNPVNTVAHLTDESDDLSTRPTTVVGISQVSGSIGETDGWKGVLVLLAGLNVFVGVFNMFPLLPFDGGHAAIATYERIRSRRGIVYRADVGKMMPVATAVVAVLALLLVSGLYLDLARPLG
jgi:membrane-associated protease RseP (regulator of RpoE activity)